MICPVHVFDQRLGKVRTQLATRLARPGVAERNASYFSAPFIEEGNQGPYGGHNDALHRDTIHVVCNLIQSTRKLEDLASQGKNREAGPYVQSDLLQRKRGKAVLCGSAADE